MLLKDVSCSCPRSEFVKASGQNLLKLFPLSHNDPVYLINTLNRELNKLSTWFAANRLSLNLSKTNFMVFKPWQKRQSFEFQVSVNEQPILRVSETMFLGVFLDDNLTWKPHISLLQPSKLSKSTGIIHKSRFFSLNSIPRYIVRFSDTSIIQSYFHTILPFHTYTIAIQLGVAPIKRTFKELSSYRNVH